MKPFKSLTAFLGRAVILCPGQKVVRSSALELQREARVRNAGLGVNTERKHSDEEFAKGGREAGRRDKHPLEQCLPREM